MNPRRMFLGLVVCWVATVSGQSPPSVSPANLATKSAMNWFESQLDDALSLYHWLHQHPELSLHEEQTAARLATEWQQIGFTVNTGIGGHGIVGVLENGEGPTVMLRTDLDALPVEEATSLPYDSQHPGVMHACGHDIHMTTITVVAKFLAEHRGLWSGTLMLIGQPAEERGLGASAMLGDERFATFPQPDYGLAVHVDGSEPTGTIMIAGGFVGANSDSVDITVRGRGGHGSAPHTTIDPIVQAADLIMSLQTIVSREVKPREPAVVTVGSIVGGTKHNVISDECRLQLTVRSHSDEVRDQLLDAIRRRAKGVAEAYGAPAPTVTVSEKVSSLRNDESLAYRMTKLFEQLLGADNVLVKERSMGFEDFSEFGRAGIPILMYGVGSVAPDRLRNYRSSGGIPSLHSATYFPDADATLRVAFRTLSAAAVELFAQPAPTQPSGGQ